MRELLTDSMEDIGHVMSNFDCEIEDWAADKLMADPARVCGGHAGWNFHGRVWFSDGLFHEEVWCYGTPREVISAPTLRELMEAVNNQYGWD